MNGKGMEKGLSSVFIPLPFIPLPLISDPAMPQNGQTSDCLAGFHSAAAPHAGLEIFFELRLQASSLNTFSPQ